jgi:hypothetical protein
MRCTSCHEVENHKMAMGMTKPALWTNEMLGHPANDEVSCASCHLEGGGGPVPSHGGFPSSHFDNIACETCHVPTVKGLVEKHFDQITQVLSNGLFKQWTFVGTKIDPESPVIPDYHWYNGTVYNDVQPRGSRGDGKIYPWKTMRAYVPEDAATGIMLPVKLGKVFGADSTLSNYGGDPMACIDDAIRTGVQLAATAQPDVYGDLVSGGSYTGTYDWIWDEMVMAINHGVKPSEQAYTCIDCHDINGGIWDWEELGYDQNPYPMAVKEIEHGSLPQQYQMYQNYPNPFNPTTNINFAIPSSGLVKLHIYDVTGSLVSTLVNGWYPSGTYQTTFSGEMLTSGVYFAKFEAEGHVQTQKLLLVK